MDLNSTVTRMTLIGYLVAAGFAFQASPARAADASGEDSLTWSRDIAPIFMNSCVSCHRPGEIGPMPLRTYGEVRPWSKSIKAVVANREMPPWHADPKVGKWANDISLEQEQIDRIVHWVDAGAPRGNAEDAPPVPEFSEGWMFGEPDYIVEFPPLEVPPGEDVYFDPKVPVEFPKGKWLRAFDIRPGNRAIAHHVNLLAGDRPTMAAQKERGEHGKAQSGGILGDSWLGSWGAGAGATRPFPEGMGRPLPDVEVITGDIHCYNSTDEVQIERTRVGFYFGEGPLEKVISLGAAGSIDLAIPPGEARYRSEGSFTFDEDVYLTALTPHMHIIGTDMTYTAIYPDGRSEVILEVPNYDFNWQTVYYPERHIPMPKGTRLQVVSHFDNSEQNPNAENPSDWVRYGLASYEEMGFGVFSYYPAEGAKARMGSMAKRVEEFARRRGDQQVYKGLTSLPQLPLKVPMAAVVPRKGRLEICIANGGMTIILDAGPIAWTGDQFSAEREGGQGLISVQGTLEDEFLQMTVRLDDASIGQLNTKGGAPFQFSGESVRSEDS